MSTVKVKVLRAFCVGGEPQKVGAVIEVSPSVAAELIGYRKAEKVVAEAKPSAKQVKESKE